MACSYPKNTNFCSRFAIATATPATGPRTNPETATERGGGEAGSPFSWGRERFRKAPRFRRHHIVGGMATYHVPRWQCGSVAAQLFSKHMPGNHENPTTPRRQTKISALCSSLTQVGVSLPTVSHTNAQNLTDNTHARSKGRLTGSVSRYL